MYVDHTSTWMVRWALFIFNIEKVINPRLMPGEYEHHVFQNVHSSNDPKKRNGNFLDNVFLAPRLQNFVFGVPWVCVYMWNVWLASTWIVSQFLHSVQEMVNSMTIQNDLWVKASQKWMLNTTYYYWKLPPMHIYIILELLNTYSEMNHNHYWINFLLI
jgi:hypothetical protein